MANTQSKKSTSPNESKRAMARGIALSSCLPTAESNPISSSSTGSLNATPKAPTNLEWRENGRRVRLSVGKDAADAAARRQSKEAELNARNNGVAVVPDSGENGHRSIAAAVAEFLEEIELTKKPKTLAAYKTTLSYFIESCPKLFVNDIERKDLLKFCAFLRENKKQSPRSVYNKFENLMSFLKANEIRGLVRKNDWPRYTEEEPEIYEQEEGREITSSDPCDWPDSLRPAGGLIADTPSLP